MEGNKGWIMGRRRSGLHPSLHSAAVAAVLNCFTAIFHHLYTKLRSCHLSSLERTNTLALLHASWNVSLSWLASRDSRLWMCVLYQWSAALIMWPVAPVSSPSPPIHQDQDSNKQSAESSPWVMPASSSELGSVIMMIIIRMAVINV